MAITFDDGFRNIYEHGLPVLQQYGFPATVFLVTDYCGKTTSWPSQPLHVKRRPLLGWAEIREISHAGITFGSHTQTHSDLRSLARHEVEKEMVVSKKIIEDAIGRPVEMLAYPYGFYNETVKRLAQANFALACGTTLGFVGPESDLSALERLDIYYLRHPMFFRRLFSRQMGAYVCLRRGIRDLRGWVPGWINRLIPGQSDYCRSTF